MIHPTITLMSGVSLRVLGADAGKAPAFAARLNNAESPEDAVKIVNECIDLSVPLYVNGIGTNNSDHWTVLRSHAVASVNCLPFD